MYIVQLSDGSTTLDLVDGAAYQVIEDGIDHGLPAARRAMGAEGLLEHGSALIEEKQPNRVVTIRLQVLSASKDGLIANVRALQAMLEKARSKQVTGFGGDATLTVQWDGASNAFVLDVLSGRLRYPRDLWSRAHLDLNNRIADATLELLCKPFARRAAISLASDTLENHQNASGAANYVDVTSVEGDVEAPAQVKLVPSGATGSKKLWVATRSGTRRTDTLWRQGEGRDSWTSLETSDGSMAESTVADAAASGGSVSRARYTDAGGAPISKEMQGRWGFVLAGPPKGLFRVLARVKVDWTDWPGIAATDVSFYQGYAFSSLVSTPAVGVGGAATAAQNAWQVLDLGELRIPPASTPDGYSLADFELRVFAAMENARSPGSSPDTIDWYLDYVFLLPADEYVAIVSNAGASDRILVDSMTPQGQVFTLDGSDKSQGAAEYTGRPLKLSKLGTRVYVLRDDAPSVTFGWSGTYQPRYVDVA